jgi:type I restriction enzyme, R subunit
MTPSNFWHLEALEPQLVRLGLLAERFFAEDANTALLKLRQFAELLAQLTASKSGVLQPSETQFDLLRQLEGDGFLPTEVFRLFDSVRRAGNSANHAFANDQEQALSALKICAELGLWFQRTFGDTAFVATPFVPPVAQANSQALQAELERLNAELEAFKNSQADVTRQLKSIELQQQHSESEAEYWHRIAKDTEQQKSLLEAQLLAAQTAVPNTSFKAAAHKASLRLHLDERQTRVLIDEQLRRAGWSADSQHLTHKNGTRPEKNKNIAIAEYPTASGPADYVLFLGLRPVAVIEAKRKNTDVSGALIQAKRYSRDYLPPDGVTLTGEVWGQYQVPLAFSSNGRAYLKQLETLSGIWFVDLRHSTNHARALQDWYTPEGIAELLKQDSHAASQKLLTEPLEYDLGLRAYQKSAIQTIEATIAAGQREMLLAMATGTGKTKTCVALIYRLLKTGRFRRVLFLVDRSALGEQASNAFTDTRLENLQTFADTFGIKTLEETKPDSATSLHIATVQGMVRRIFQASEQNQAPPIDQYDCIVVDECHRGYTLDRELSDTELNFRDFEDYISKYRRVLEHFDAVKIGLTATPALHTSAIFGEPVFVYSYREAVMDGFLVDQEPPIQISTELSQEGIHWTKGQTVTTFDPSTAELQTFNTPDDLDFEIEAFNKKVLTEGFNREVCKALATEIDPSSPAKTLIFCATDLHADMVVRLLKDAFRDQYGSVEDDAVQKITGKADKPLELLRFYKNERLPNVAVTVDLLSTGVDIPTVCNLVFLRRVNSRILYEQMIGRATRLCPEIGKEAYRVFDAVGITEALQNFSDMRPVVVNPKRSFGELLHELQTQTSQAEQDLIRQELIAKLQRKKRQPDPDPDTQSSIEALIQALRQASSEQLPALAAAHSALGVVLDQKTSRANQVFISDHEDSLRHIRRGYGQNQRPEDYLEAFKQFVEKNQSEIPALMAVLTRPKELTRKQLKELRLALDQHQFNTTTLRSAWRDSTNQDIAAGIVDFIRQAAKNEPIVPYNERVDRALQKILGSQAWTNPQRDWLRKIAAQTKANEIVDREALDNPDELFKRDGGGFARLDKIFNGQLHSILEQFNQSLWEKDAA